MADSRHTTKAAAAPQEGHSQTTTGGPVVELSRELLRLWDADDSAQRELDSAASASVKVDTQVEFGEWRDAVETIIGFSQAASLEGALIQLALALDTIRDIFRGNEGELDRRLRSAIHGIRQSLHTELDPTVRSLLKIYGASDETYPLWIDRGRWLGREGADATSPGRRLTDPQTVFHHR